jgi:hypothetical protein
MNTEQFFSISSSLAFTQWSLMILLPKWKFTLWTINFRIAPFILSVAYAICITEFFKIPSGDFESLAELKLVFSHDQLLLAGWIHYLVVPCLILTFIFGPCGYLLYQVIQKLKSSK